VALEVKEATRTIVKRALACVLLVMALTAAEQPPARDVQSIAAVVNDDIISIFDLTARLKLVIFSSNLDDTPETRQRLVPIVLRGLIDERLQLQEAEAELEKQNKAPEGSLDELLAAKGIDRSTLVAQIRATLAWSKLVRRQIRPTVDVGKDEIDEALARMEDLKDKPQNLLAEIFLAVDYPEEEEEVRQTAERLVLQIAGGASFPALARQFSESATALSGGDLGWVPQGQLEEELDKTVQLMEPPALSKPIRTLAGYSILLLRDRRIAGGDRGMSVSLRQIHLPVPADATTEGITSQSALAKTIGETVAGCDDMGRLGEELGSALSGDLGWIDAEDLPQNLRETVLGLEIGEVSEPVRTQDAVLLLMVCDRKEPEAVIPAREEVTDALFLQRVEMMARRYLRDMRRSASVDRRL
jgi:peptidyl-prolyl cis-trans isomerase SurA